MGRTKQFDSEIVLDTLRQAKRRKSVVPSTGKNPAQQDEVTVEMLLRHFQTRIWRFTLAFFLRFHTITKGFFQRHAFVKSLTLGLTAYLLLFSENAWVQEQRRTFFEPSGIQTSKKSTFSLLNDAAPVGVNELAEAEAREYIERYAPVAVTEMKKYGIPASISLAQGLVESRAGKSTLAKRNNNHFGIKCFSRKCRKGHCSNHTDDTHKDFFRIFPSAWESWRAHSQMLANGRYTVLRKKGTDYKEWAHGLKELGYATDRKYDAKLIGMIEKYELYKFDRP